jgi:hypothetical protein
MRQLAEIPEKNRALRLVAFAILFAAAFPWCVKAETVYSGITADELIAFARNEGWKAQSGSSLRSDRLVIVQTDVASNGAPPAGSVLVGQFTTGGCIHVCETLAMCKDGYINEKNGDCWLVLDRQHADFTRLIESCPRPDGRAFSAEMSGGTWRLACASAPAAPNSKVKPGSGASPGSGGLEKLFDIKPF